MYRYTMDEFCIEGIRPYDSLANNYKNGVGNHPKNEEVANLINKYKELTGYRPKEMDNDK